MLKTDIIIPSYKSIDRYLVLDKLKESRSTEGQIIFTGQKVSAAKNRNIGLSKVTADYIIMIDDDIDGFYKGWDEELLRPLLDDPSIELVSARLLDRNGLLGDMMSNNRNISDEIIVPANGLVPSACIAFRGNINLTFDEMYIGSGYEDTDFCFQIKKRNPNSKIVINNRCKVIHHNEKKNQMPNLGHNGRLFKDKWGVLP